MFDVEIDDVTLQVTEVRIGIVSCDRTREGKNLALEKVLFVVLVFWTNRANIREISVPPVNSQIPAVTVIPPEFFPRP